VRTNIQDLKALKAAGEPIAMLTVYDYPSARIAERAGAPMVLVGDSLGMVVLGYKDTLAVTVDDMVRHAGAVVRGCEQPLVVADLPFLSYATLDLAIASAGRLMQEAGVGAVKLEGAGANIAIVARLTELGVPVMAHLGLTPQAVHQIGLKVQAKAEAEAQRLIADALALEAAGAFALVLELVPAELAREVTSRLSIPVIGIGAGPWTDGQVQVWHDLLGLYEGKPPKHAGRFGEIGQAMEQAIATYVGAVRQGSFPKPRPERPAAPQAQLVGGLYGEAK
jgi:3-methyl-2-oxobutanoate hydroxymethyltransferase